MDAQASRLSRRNFVGNSAIALGVFGAAGLAPQTARSVGQSGPDPIPPGETNARNFGAKGDGKSDDTKELQSALDAAQTGGPLCYVPRGLYRLDGPLVVPAGVTLCGSSGGVPHSEHPIGTVLLAFGGRGDIDG